MLHPCYIHVKHGPLCRAQGWEGPQTLWAARDRSQSSRSVCTHSCLILLFFKRQGSKVCAERRNSCSFCVSPPGSGRWLPGSQGEASARFAEHAELCRRLLRTWVSEALGG